jgi:site-specific recombinase XerD
MTKPQTVLIESFDCSLISLFKEKFEPEQLAGRPIMTRRGYLYSLQRLGLYLSREPVVSDLNETAIALFVEWLERQAYSPATVRNTLGCLRAVWQYATWLGLITEGPPRWFCKRDKPWTKAPRDRFVVAPLPTANLEVAPAAINCKLVAGLVERCILERELGQATVRLYWFVVKRFDKALGRPAKLTDLNDDTVNRWLLSLHASGLAPDTMRSYRRCLLSLWRAAHEWGLLKKQPGRVRKIKRPDRVPICWSPEELTTILATCSKLAGTMRRDLRIRRSAFWRAYVLVGYETGLRLSDLLALEWKQVADDSKTSVVLQQKTRKRIAFRLSESTQAAVAETQPGERRKIFGDLISKQNAQEYFKAILCTAGLPGSSKWLRRSGATSCEIEHPGSAMAYLGHKTPGLAYECYVDPTKIQHAKPLPAPIELPNKGPQSKGGAA